MSTLSLFSNVTQQPHVHHPQCEVPLHLPKYFAPLVGVGIFALFLISFTIAYARKEQERAKNYYGRVDAASHRTDSARDKDPKTKKEMKEKLELLQQDSPPIPAGEPPLPAEASAAQPSDEDEAAEDELHGHNPNKMSVVRDCWSPTQASLGIKVMMKKRKTVTQRSVVGTSRPRVTSSTVSALSIFAPHIIFDSTGRGIEILDIVSKGNFMQMNEAKMREDIVDSLKSKLDEIRERRHIIFAIPEKNAEPIVRGAASIVGMMKQTLVLSVGFDMPAMKVYCYELDVGELAGSILGAGSGSGSAQIVAASAEKVKSGGVKAISVAPAKSPVPNAQIVPANQPASSGKSAKKKSSGQLEVTTQQTITVPARSPSSSTCPTKKSIVTPSPTPQKRSAKQNRSSTARKTGRRPNSNYSRVRTARTPGAKTPRTLVTAIENSMFSVQTTNNTTRNSKSKSPAKSNKKLYDV